MKIYRATESKGLCFDLLSRSLLGDIKKFMLMTGSHLFEIVKMSQLSYRQSNESQT